MLIVELNQLEFFVVSPVFTYCCLNVMKYDLLSIITFELMSFKIYVFFNVCG